MKINPGLATRLRSQYEADRDHYEAMQEDKKSTCGDYHFKVMKKGVKKRNRTIMSQRYAADGPWG